MMTSNEYQFQFKQNNHESNAKSSNINNRRQQHNVFSDDNNKLIICSNQKLGINIQQHLNKIQHFYEEKLLKQNIMKAVIGTFQKKKIIQQGEFKIKQAYEDASNQSKAYVDKLETWLSDSIACSPALQQFQMYKKKKLSERTAKISSIMNLVQKIAQKLQNKKIQSIKKQFQQSLEPKMVKIPQNKQYNKAIYKLKFIKQRVAINAQRYENKQQNFY